MLAVANLSLSSRSSPRVVFEARSRKTVRLRHPSQPLRRLSAFQLGRRQPAWKSTISCGICVVSVFEAKACDCC